MAGLGPGSYTINDEGLQSNNSQGVKYGTRQKTSANDASRTKLGSGQNIKGNNNSGI